MLVLDIGLVFLAFPRMLAIIRSVVGSEDIITESLRKLEKIAQEGDRAGFIRALVATTRRSNPRSDAFGIIDLGDRRGRAIVMNNVFQGLSRRLGESHAPGQLTTSLLENKLAPALHQVRRSWQTGNSIGLCRGLASLDKLSLAEEVTGERVAETTSVLKFTEELRDIAQKMRGSGQAEVLLWDLALKWSTTVQEAGRHVDPLVILAVDVLKEGVPDMVGHETPAIDRETIVLISFHLDALEMAIRKDRYADAISELSVLSLLFRGEPV